MPPAGLSQSTPPRQSKTSLKKLFIYLIIGSISVAALAGIFTILTGSFDALSLRVLATTTLIGGVSIMALIASSRLETSAQVLSKWIFLASGVWFVTHLTLIWVSGTFESEWLWKVAIVAMVATISLAHIALLTGENRTAALRIIYALTVMMIAAVAGIIIYLVINAFGNSGDSLFRALAAIAILDVLGTILVPLLRRMARPTAKLQAVTVDSAVPTNSTPSAASENPNPESPANLQ